MILKMCAVYDSATQMFGRPFFMVAHGQAIRSFRDEVMRNEANNDLNKHPADFTLYALGDFDDSTGLFTAEVAPAQLIRGVDVINVISE